ncbi:hypothetical protein [Pseudocitrobacter sp. 73]|uniref:hypothetical protein n=1 Tax=Pseudocitrobacter TaxID=1504576 RepID=UPI0011ED9604|nr:hypothetical protein [Pseudocitrobacter sp. 73]KAA1047270.1 hypothetical protein F0Q32_20340 [Pseudocitrobacter sp. 73]
MNLLEASARIERIELLAKFAHADNMSVKEKTIALVWIGEIAEEVMQHVRELKNPHSGGFSGGGFQ